MKAVSFQLERADLAAFITHNAGSKEGVRARRKMFLLFLAFSAIAMGVPLLIAALGGASWERAIPPLAVMALIMAVVSAVNFPLHRFVERAVKQQFADPAFVEKFTSRRQWEITPDSLAYSSEFDAGALSWASFVRIDVAPAHAFLFLHGGQGWILPKHAFQHAEEFDEFVKQAQEYIAKARLALDPQQQQASEGTR